ncbi:MAG TPA: hypothetical protein VJ826_15920, partial [Candidatus Polarisedimenticolaceae bacterium]|nr:hypothetical protein [Candidatus Polarisedimenticolaceae bacterium]
PWVLSLAWAPRTRSLSSPARSLLWIWIAVPLSVFAISRSRLPLYVLPLFVPMALLIAPRVTALVNRHPRRMAMLGGAWIALVLALKGYGAPPIEPGDTRALAARAREIASTMSAPMNEIVFVDSKPLYSLRFYTGVPIERVRLGGDAEPSPEPDDSTPSVCEEAREHEHPLWLVPGARATAFENEARACGLTLHLLPCLSNDLHGYEVLGLS